MQAFSDRGSVDFWLPNDSNVLFLFMGDHVPQTQLSVVIRFFSVVKTTIERESSPPVISHKGIRQKSTQIWALAKRHMPIFYDVLFTKLQKFVQLKTSLSGEIILSTKIQSAVWETNPRVLGSMGDWGTTFLSTIHVHQIRRPKHLKTNYKIQ